MKMTTVRRRLRRLKDPLGTARSFLNLVRKIRAEVYNPLVAVVPQRSRMTFPSSPGELRKTDFFNKFWYYEAELLPGVFTTGLYPRELPMLPRIMLRECDAAGMSFLELGSAEGLMPVMMKRRGADRVLAVDAIDFDGEKMEALKHYYGVDFEFKSVGLMHDLQRKLAGNAFDIINCSGLLYHVYSPMSVLAGIRPLLKRNGLLVVSTGILRDPGYLMEFNNAGRIQEEANTFWYISLPLLDYVLRYLKLAPIDCCFLWHSSLPNPPVRLRFDKPSGYMSVVCRAVDDVLPLRDDQWMARSAEHSWEYRGVTDWQAAKMQPESLVQYTRPPHREAWRDDTNTLDLWKATETMQEVAIANGPQDAHTMRLSDLS